LNGAKDFIADDVGPLKEEAAVHAVPSSSSALVSIACGVAGDGDSTNRKSSGRRDSKRRSSGIRESIARQRASAAEANQPSNKLALSRFRVLALASAKEMNFDVRSEDREDSDEDAMDKVGWCGDFKSKDSRTFRRECLHTAVRACAR
jgi:hypothetical protein